ncbi:MAG: SagB-type dehydrogenase family enzyme [Phenylobacterium sp.]|jgi:SagB-type dehydrogenase family enzyme
MSNLKRKNKTLSSEERWDDSQAALFHEFTKFTPADINKKSPRIAEYLVNPRYVLETARNYKTYSTANKIALAPPEAKSLDFANLLQNRQSHRHFSGESIEFQALSNLLSWSASVTRIAELPGFPDENIGLRPYPSGGGLYPSEIYVVAINVNELEPGVYHYSSRNNELELVHNTLDTSELKNIFMADNFIDSIGCIIVITSMFERATTKYGDRGYRIALLEAGHLAQNLLLSAAAQQLDSLAWGGFYDNKVAELLNVNVIDEPPVHTTFIGRKKDI